MGGGGGGSPVLIVPQGPAPTRLVPRPLARCATRPLLVRPGPRGEAGAPAVSVPSSSPLCTLRPSTPSYSGLTPPSPPVCSLSLDPIPPTPRRRLVRPTGGTDVGTTWFQPLGASVVARDSEVLVGTGREGRGKGLSGSESPGGEWAGRRRT